MTDLLTDDGPEYSPDDLGVSKDAFEELSEGDHIVWQPYDGHPPVGGTIREMGGGFFAATVEMPDDYPWSRTLSAGPNLTFETHVGPADWPETPDTDTGWPDDD